MESSEHRAMWSGRNVKSAATLDIIRRCRPFVPLFQSLPVDKNSSPDECDSPPPSKPLWLLPRTATPFPQSESCNVPPHPHALGFPRARPRRSAPPQAVLPEEKEGAASQGLVGASSGKRL